MNDQEDRPVRRTAVSSWWIILACTLFALALRMYFTSTAVVGNPISGDAREYTAYAWNLIHHGTFSGATPSPSPPSRDSYRDPGYPVVLAAVVSAFPTHWYDAIRWLQCLLGALTVAALLIAARQWLQKGWLLTAGLVMASWPHCVTIPTYLLSETLFAFLVAVALLATNECIGRRNNAWACAAGFAFGVAALTNAVVLPFAPILAAVAAWRSPSTRRQWLTLLVFASLLPAAWLLRSATIDTGPSASSRASANFVQGSWASYHAAAHGVVAGDEASKQTMNSIDGEITEMSRSRMAGLLSVYSRLRETPRESVVWYLSKPALLWSWNLQIASGHIYPFATSNSPFQMHNVLYTTTQMLIALNSWFSIAALVGCALVAFRGSSTTPVVMTALLVYVTAVYSLLQAEPRYAIAFRGEEILLAILAIATAVEAILNPSGSIVRRFRRTTSHLGG